MESLFYGLFVLLIADIAVMAYTYKSYFGRNLFWETVEPEIAEKKFSYDENTEKYTRDRSKEIVEDAKIKISTNIANNAVDTAKKADLRKHAREALKIEREALPEAQQEAQPKENDATN